jgi:hypothetical protein
MITIKKIIVYNILCKLGLHKYKKYVQRKRCTGLINDTINIPVRECTKCGKIEHHLMSKCGTLMVNWKPYKHKDSEVINLRRI